MKEAKCPGLDLPLQLLSSFRRGRCSGGAPGLVKHNIVYILCKHILYVLCKDIVYKFSLISGQFYPLSVDHCELKRPFSSGTPVYPR